MAVKKPSSADIKAQYGFVALLGREIPEIGKLLKKAVKGEWTAERFSMAIINTSWWKRTPSTVREWVTLKITDPRTAMREMHVGASDVRNRSVMLGVEVGSSRRAQSIWLNAKLRGYNEDQINGYIFRSARFDNDIDRMKSAGGRYGELLNEMKETAYAYGFMRHGDWEEKHPNAVKQIVGSANKIMAAGGTAKPSQWEARMKSFAKSRYAAFADRIEAGETVLDIADPYKQSLSEILELNPEDIDLNDTVLNKALQGRKSEKGPQAYALWEVEDLARRDGRWQKTDNAMESAAQVVDYIGKSFGFVA